MQNPSLVFLVITPLIAWRLYKRFKRLVSRQASVAWRHWTAAVLFPLLLVLLGASARDAPDADLALEALLGGVVVGIALALFGLRWTRFEVTEQGLYYTPNAHIGIALFVLLICRVGYRMFQGYEGATGSLPGGGGGYHNSPLTLLVFATLAGYYATYAIGLLRWRKTVGA